MAEEVSSQLTETLLHKLQEEPYALLATVDAETGIPVVNAVSWIFAPNEKHLRVAVGHRSRVIANVKANPAVTITLIGPETTYSIVGRARVAHERLQGVQIKAVGIVIDIEKVDDVMFHGGQVVKEPQYTKTYDREAAEKLDRQVMEAIKRG
ncbi:MAG: nitroreductase/quinone reductase family protein [Firmicutes bacterium]|uniref:Pyridoxamine 5'-phosphate oxidase n=1 Tax=Melghirimyces thermohalophilus TaxID=1236220 RepID=A0A1G6HPI4_9BACL|nr:pyridoxamine 5'-phosphate oxidase family protein [Melghirimyces thermohalophilus]MDA8353898.1 nitroreductase/quinone reductase family protein [Bacillota bacterium]SDB96150.1 Pyridoxamine 5'-phosphate oxidase [Melghirimyces thermohalophilus]